MFSQLSCPWNVPEGGKTLLITQLPWQMAGRSDHGLRSQRAQRDSRCSWGPALRAGHVTSEPLLCCDVGDKHLLSGVGSSYSAGSSISKQCVSLGPLLPLRAPAFLGTMRGLLSGPLALMGPQPLTPVLLPPGAAQETVQGLWLWDLGCDQPGHVSWPLPSCCALLGQNNTRKGACAGAWVVGTSGSWGRDGGHLNNNKPLALGTVCSDTRGWLGSIPALPPSSAPPLHFLLLSLQGCVSGTGLGPVTRAGIPLGHLVTSARRWARRLHTPDLRPLSGTRRKMPGPGEGVPAPGLVVPRLPSQSFLGT